MTEQQIRLDEVAELHERLSAQEAANVRLSRRVTALEDFGKGNYSGDDPMRGLFSPGLIWLAAIAMLAPVIAEVIKNWRSS